MKFSEAYDIAMQKSMEFREFDAWVKDAFFDFFTHPRAHGEDVGVLTFSVSPGESFYYGFDGVDLHKGKHTKKRTSILTERDDVLIIL